MRATDNFSARNVVGEGGFSAVYKGVLEDGTMVAVKKLKKMDAQGAQEFFAEAQVLRYLHHRNVVKLLGICQAKGLRCLVYELVGNGSVESHLHGTKPGNTGLGRVG